MPEPRAASDEWPKEIAVERLLMSGHLLSEIGLKFAIEAAQDEPCPWETKNGRGLVKLIEKAHGAMQENWPSAIAFIKRFVHLMDYLCCI